MITGDIKAFQEICAFQVKPSDASEKNFYEAFVKERCKQPESLAAVDFMLDVDAKCNYFEK